MLQTPVRSITLAEFLARPETKPASEYIDGQIIQKPMHQGQHSIIQRQLLFAIDPVLSDVGIAQAFPELRRNFADRSIVPDVAVFESHRPAISYNFLTDEVLAQIIEAAQGIPRQLNYICEKVIRQAAAKQYLKIDLTAWQIIWPEMASNTPC